MDVILQLKLLLLLFTVVLFSKHTGAVNCWECNARGRGQRKSCNEPRNVTGCIACLKSTTKIWMHNKWTEYIYADVLSKACVHRRATVREEGCYESKIPNGISRQCYCFSHSCNSGKRVTSSTWINVLSAATAFLFFSICR